MIYPINASVLLRTRTTFARFQIKSKFILFSTLGKKTLKNDDDDDDVTMTMQMTVMTLMMMVMVKMIRMMYQLAENFI